jgi:hypothetical protein
VNETPSLVEQVLGGESYELRVLAAQGILPLSPAELVPLQVRLAGADDPFLAESARASLLALEPRLAQVYLATEAPDEVMRWFATHSGDPTLVETVVRRRDVSRELLADLAPGLAADLQEALLLRQDAILDRPGILDALDSNPRLTPFARRRILEYREHLLPRSASAAALAVSSDQLLEPAPATDESLEGLTEEELDEVERIRRLAEAADVERTTGLSEHQIRALPVPVRLRLAQGAARSLRAILVRDINPHVAVSVLHRSAFNDDEIEQLAGSRAVVDEVLLEIAKKREWTARYTVCHNLARNPRVPVAIAIKMLARLSVRDLRTISRDRNVAEAVRSTSQRLYRMKAV